MDLDEQTKSEAARWRMLKSALDEKARKYEEKRAAWMGSKTSGEYAHAEAVANRAAHEIASHVALVFRVLP